MLRIAKVLSVIVGVVALFLAAGDAFAVTYPFPDMSPTDCTVRDNRWVNRSRALTIPLAMTFANSYNPTELACQKNVNLEIDRTTMLTPFYIVGGGSSDTAFTIHGKAGGKTELDAKLLAGKGFQCAVEITGPYVTLDGITLTGVPSDMNAVCIKNADTANGSFATLKNLRIDSGMSGIVFDQGITKSVIESTVSIAVNGSGYAVDFGPGTELTLSENLIKPVEDSIIAGMTTDDFGLIEPPPDATKLMISAPQVSQFFNNKSNVQVCLKRSKELTSAVDPQDQQYIGSVRVEGFVVDMSTLADPKVPASPDKPGSTAALYQDIVRLQMYDSNGFRAYVSDWKNLATGGGVGMGSTQQTGTGETVGKSGYFKFYIKPKNTSDTQIVLVPEVADHKLAQPSNPIRITGDDSGDCVDRVLGGETGGGGGGGGGGLANAHRFKSVQECMNTRGISEVGESGTELSTVFDTDGDGISDDEEDLNHNCLCDNDETCYMNPDTDGDGIPEMKGPGKEIPCMNAQNVVVKCTDSTVANLADADVDGDGVPNALDKDSDGDGRWDYQEDRSFYYDDLLKTLTDADRSAMKGLYYTWNQGTRDDHPLMLAGALLKCDLGNALDIGVRYDWYTVAYEADGFTLAAEPVRLGDKLPDATKPQSLELLRCRHQALASSKNFNGVYDSENLETNMVSVDTDGDGWCDGKGEQNNDKCGTAKKTDKCPTVADTTNQCKQMACNSLALLYGTDPTYINFSEGTPQSLMVADDGVTPLAIVQKDADGKAIKDANGKFKYKSWQEIQRVCFGDLDQDGIPNCVESPHSVCGIDQTSGLDPSKADTDDDGFLDGWKGNENGQNLEDVCPMTAGAADQDKFAEGKKNYSCGDGTTVYKNWQILSCFFDRDGDNLRDCDEDKDMDGNYNNIIEGVEGIGTTESNSLSKDSDSDGVTDTLEVNGWLKPTNPADMDTDRDGLTDKEEDRDGDGKIVLPQDRSGYGCGVEERTLDTDPTNADTDGDGIADGMEVKGTIYDPDEQPFLTLLEDQNIWTHGGIGHGSNANAKDSDGDGLTDSQEYNGSVITYGDSNPCLKDSDNDGIMDPDEFVNCALNKDPNCSGTGVKLKDAAANNTPKDSSGGIDSDGDGLTNECEALLKTNPHEMDSDLDGVFDGDEILYSKYHVCKFDITKGESDPNNPDTDNDGLNDGMEMRYGTYAWNADSDGDCIPDGPSQVTTPDGQTISSAGEDANADGIYEAGVETNALSPDTDGDGLPDGMVAGLGEDRNCNGIRDKNADGSWAETDPRMPDSDFDGEGDYQEITAGGFPNYDANMGNATMGHQGCMNIAGDGSLASNGMMYLFGLLLIVNRVVSLRMRKERVK